MGIRRTRAGLLLVAVLAAAGCRTRLPVDSAVAVAAAERSAPDTAQPAVPDASRSLSFRESPDAEVRTGDPMRPFLAEVEPDRMRDMVRMDRLADHGSNPFGLIPPPPPVCLPAAHSRR